MIGCLSVLDENCRSRMLKDCFHSVAGLGCCTTSTVKIGMILGSCQFGRLFAHGITYLPGSSGFVVALVAGFRPTVRSNVFGIGAFPKVNPV